MAKVKSDKSPTITGSYEVPDGWVKELNFFDMTGAKAGTKGTSNKFYHIELQVAKDGNCQIFTQYGRTGVPNPVSEWRYFGADRASVEKEFESILKSKTKKGYREIDVAQRALGSAEAQKQTKAVVLKNADAAPAAPKSSLTTGQKSIVQLPRGKSRRGAGAFLPVPHISCERKAYKAKPWKGFVPSGIVESNSRRS